jgi:tRNA A-37 threonylcarbamoyl transferase component Bud32
MNPISSSRGDARPREPLPAGSAFWVREEFRETLAQHGLGSLAAVFACESGLDLAKPNLGRFRRRLRLEVQPRGAPSVRVFLKRYDRPPRLEQLRHWLRHRRRRSFARTEGETAERLAACGIPAPRIVAFGEQWGLVFERRSFLMTAEIPDSEALERRLPPCFDDATAPEGLAARRAFIRRLGTFIGRFHNTGFRHRDLYLSHVFCSRDGAFALIDLARASRPIRRRRFQVKDLAQLHFSAPAPRFSRTDRLRFYLAYVGWDRLGPADKVFLRRVMRKAAQMARHSARHGARIPFLGG